MSLFLLLSNYSYKSTKYTKTILKFSGFAYCYILSKEYNKIIRDEQSLRRVQNERIYYL